MRLPREEQSERALSLPGVRKDVIIANAIIKTPPASERWLCRALCSTCISSISGPPDNQEAFCTPFWSEEQEAQKG